MERIKDCLRTVARFSRSSSVRAVTRAIATLCLLMLVDVGSPPRAQAYKFHDEARRCVPLAGPSKRIDIDLFKRLYEECERHVCIPIYLNQASDCPKAWLRSRLEEDFETCSRTAHEESMSCRRHCAYGARERATGPSR